MEKIKGYIDHIIYHNAENGYTVFELVAEEEIICVGNLKTVEQGETIEAQGEYTEHPMYGRQFKLMEYQVLQPEDVVSVERYLGSGAIKGVGPALATRIVKKFGESTFSIIEKEPERLAEIKGISERKAREIAQSMEEKKDMRQAMIFLQRYGITNQLAVRIYEKYGSKIYGVLQENPYRLAEEVNGIGFKIADEIASKIGIHTDSDYRIRSAVLYVLLQMAIEGNVYLPQPVLLCKTADLLQLKEEQIENQIFNLVMDKKIIIKKKEDETCVYASFYYYAELNIARMLLDLKVNLETEEYFSSTTEQLQSKIERLGIKTGLMLDPLQKKAVEWSIKNTLLILTGGPGTGKTTTINMMIRYFEEEGMDIFLAAPTGRAAKRMTEATGYEAKTLHRLLEINGEVAEDAKKAAFEKNAENPLEADVIIVDEMSMVDIHLFQALLSAIMPGTRLIMVGDTNQLPSVGPGQVLGDMIRSKEIPVLHLETVFRQAEESDIVVNAHRINKGKNINLDNKSKDFFFLKRDDVQVIYKHMVQLITEKLPRYLQIESYEIQVLTPMRKGNLGVETLNKILQNHLNPPDKKKAECTYGEHLFRVGDKVMQIKNNYKLEWEIVSKYGIPIDKGMGIFNGDMGVVKEINEYSQTLIVEYDEHKRVTYPFQTLDEIEMAYAITIHKSQGSEYPAVIIPLLSGPKMLFNRNLLYTGVTRARQMVTILGSDKMIFEMIKNENQQKRYSGLHDCIWEIIKKEKEMNAFGEQ